MYHVIPRMRNANYVNKYGDFGTPSISMERFNVETPYLVSVSTITSIFQQMTNYPLKWTWSGSLRTPNFVG